MEGGLQPPPTTLGTRQHAASRVRKTGRMRPEMKPRTLHQVGGDWGLRSALRKPSAGLRPSPAKSLLSRPPLTIRCDCRNSWTCQHNRAASRPPQTPRRRFDPDHMRLSQRRSSHP
jgi:hypothetical protein